MGAVTLSGDGDVSVAGVLAQSLENTTLSGTGAVGINGSLSQTLEASTLSGSGTLSVGSNGDLDKTLDALTLSGAGIVVWPPVIGTSTPTLEALMLSGVGEVTWTPVIGTSTPMLAAVTLSGAGLVDVHGTAAVELEGVTLDGYIYIGEIHYGLIRGVGRDQLLESGDQSAVGDAGQRQVVAMQTRNLG